MAVPTPSWTTHRSRSVARGQSSSGAASPSTPASSDASIPTPWPQVCEEARPDPRDADELHDLLLHFVVAEPQAAWADGTTSWNERAGPRRSVSRGRALVRRGAAS